MNPSGPCNVTMAGKLVRFLRSGFKREVGANVRILAIEVDTTIDRETYYGALARFDAARTARRAAAAGVAKRPVAPVLASESACDRIP